MPILRIEIPKEANAEVVTKDLDMIDELREAAAVHTTSCQQRLTNLYNRRVKPCTFRDEELVLRRVFDPTNPIDGKFQPNWERPYMVVQVGAVGSYALNKLDGTPVPRM